VGIYGRKGSGKSLLFDKVLNLAGVDGSHVTLLLFSTVGRRRIMKRGCTFTVFHLGKPVATCMYFCLTVSGSSWGLLARARGRKICCWT
jgi:hypothetical protein